MSGIIPTIENFAKGTFATAAGLGTVGVGLLFFGQNYLIYPSAFPPGSRTEVATPIDYGLPYHNTELLTPDGVKLRCYSLIQRKDMSHVSAHEIETLETETDEEFAGRRPTVIMFHGNGGNLGHRIPLAKIFYVKMRCNVFMMSYRGYGHSEGSPSEKGIKIDAQCALDWIQAHPALSESPIFLYGQSIGGAVSIDLAGRNPHAIRAMILENTFLSLPRLVPNAFPILGPFAFLCHQKWDSASKIPLLPREMPILMLSGTQDEVVPRDHMVGLWELVQQRKSGRKGPTAEETSEGDGQIVHSLDESAYSKLVEFAHGTHNDTCVQNGYWVTVAEFIGTLMGDLRSR